MDDTTEQLSSARSQLLQIQSDLIARVNNFRLNEQIDVRDLMNLSGIDLIQKIQDNMLLSVIHETLLDQIDRMLDGRTPLSEYSVVGLIAYVIGQLMTVRAFTHMGKGKNSQLKTTDAERELMILVDYLASYTGREILPRFE